MARPVSGCFSTKKQEIHDETTVKLTCF